jgi:protein TonB
MHQGTYLDSTNNRPIRLGIVVALHGAALAAIILAPAEMIPIKVFTPTQIDFIEDKAPPPPEPAPRAKDLPKSNISHVPLAVNVERPDLSQITVDPLPPFTEDVAPKVTPIPVPNPVLVDATLDPRYGDRVQPDYPSALARQEITGTVTVRILIGADGRVKQVQQVSATDPLFFEATQRQALKYWRFKPAMRDGIAIESWQTKTVRFKLES